MQQQIPALRPGAGLTLRSRDGKTFVTDNGNVILDCAFGLIDDPAGLAAILKSIHGVVDVGIFINLASAVLYNAGAGVAELTRP